MNDFFISVFTKDEPSVEPPMLEPRPFEECMHDFIIDKEEARKAIKQTNPNKSSGPDNIHTKLIVETIDQSCGSLTSSINLYTKANSLMHGNKST